MKDRPDFLVFMCDQLTSFTLGAYGQPAAQTLVVDEMAQQGVIFDAAIIGSNTQG